MSQKKERKLNEIKGKTRSHLLIRQETRASIIYTHRVRANESRKKTRFAGNVTKAKKKGY